MAQQTSRSNRSRITFSIPVEERIRYYFILGFRANEIAQFLCNEFRELELATYSRSNVNEFIRRNREELEKAEHDFRMDIRQRHEQELRRNFTDAHSLEIEAVQVYIRKGREILTAMDELDLTKQDEDKNFVNRGQMGTLMMLFKEQHAMIAKLSQTDAAREYALFVRKLNAKAQEGKDAGMLDTEVTFLDGEKVDFFNLKDAKKKIGGS